MQLSSDLEKYILAHSSTEQPVLHHIFRQSNLKMVNPRMVSGHIQGLLLSMLSQMIQPEKVLEIGTYTGYSAICLARGLKPNGILHTIEVNDETAEFAKENFREAEMESQIVQHVGNSLEIIPQLNEMFDIIFIDGEKREYPEYYLACKDIIQKGGLLIADNVLWDGKVVNPAAQAESATKAVMEFNRLIQNDPYFRKFASTRSRWHYVGQKDLRMFQFLLYFREIEYRTKSKENY